MRNLPDLLQLAEQQDYDLVPLVNCVINASCPRDMAESLLIIYFDLAYFVINDPELSSPGIQTHLYRLRSLIEALQKMQTPPN